MSNRFRSRVAMTRALALVLAVAVGAALWVYGEKWIGRARPSALTTIVVAGGDGGGLPRAEPTAEGFDAQALGAVSDYAAAHGAGTLVVTRHGHLIVERYSGEANAETLIDGGGFGYGLDPTLAMLAAGIAVTELHMALPPRTRWSTLELPDAIAKASKLSYPQFLSRNLWQPLNASPAHWSGAALSARATDWLRVAQLLLHDGNFEGSQVLPKGWVQFLDRPRALPGAEPLAASDGYVLRGASGIRLWVVPRFELAILGVASDDETRLPNGVIRAIRDRQSTSGVGLKDLVPGH